MPKASSKKLNNATLKTGALSSSHLTAINFTAETDSKLFLEFKILRTISSLTEQVVALERKLMEITCQYEEKAKFQEKLVYTRKEVCEILNTTNQTLYNWNKANILKASHLGDKVYYKAEDINNALIKSR